MSTFGGITCGLAFGLLPVYTIPAAALFALGFTLIFITERPQQ